MLKQRVASALALAAAVAAAVLLLPQVWLWCFFGLLALAAGYEWAKLSGIRAPGALAACLAALAATIAALAACQAPWPLALGVALAAWLLGAALLLAWPRTEAVFRSAAIMLPAGLAAIAGAWVGLATLHARGPAMVIWLLAATTLADAGAYFAGRRFGRRKLAPRISPGKTLEGLAGGGLATLAWGVAGAWHFGDGLAVWLGVAGAVFAASVVGDLFESAMKRARGVKDSGAALPGHGGVLDRIDSVLAAAPVAALLATLALAA